MPFTPFHFGLGLPLKAAMPRHFSLTAFGLTQVAIDLEPLYYMLQGEAHLHRFWHTYVGATFIAAGVALVNKPLARLARRLAQAEGFPTRTATWTGALVGAYSHVLLDSLMHTDIAPLSPFTSSNSLLTLVSLDLLHNSLLGGAGVGSWILFIRSGTNRRSHEMAD